MPFWDYAPETNMSGAGRALSLSLSVDSPAWWLGRDLHGVFIRFICKFVGMHFGILVYLGTLGTVAG